MQKEIGRRKRSLICSEVLIFFTLILFWGNLAQGAAEKPYELPKTIYWGSRYVGASLYTIAVTMMEQLGKETGRKFRLIPGEDVDMIHMLNSGKIQLATFAADNFWASMGLANYAEFALGPQPLRMVWPGAPLTPGTAGIATKTSGIRTAYDLKGKRVAVLTGAAWSDMSIRAQLAFAKLTYKDVVVLEFSSMGSIYKALAEGKVDYGTGGVGSPGTIEIASSPYGLVVVSFPHEDKEGWARMRSIVPYFLPGWCIGGPGMKKDEKIPTTNYPWPITTTLASQSEDFVYTICKGIHKRMDSIVAAFEPNGAMATDRAITPEASIMAPYHPGAIKFFKEIGIWTSAHEGANNKRLEQLRKLNKRWDEFANASQEKMEKTGKKVDPVKEWPLIVEKEIGMLP